MRARAVVAVTLAMLSVGWAGEKPKKADEHKVPPVWSAFYNAEQGPLPDVSQWKTALEQKGITVRVAEGVDWRRYEAVEAGEARYTGSEMSLKPREIAQLTDLLQKRLEKDLKKVKLTPGDGAQGRLVVDANITNAKAVNRLWNAAQVGDDRGRATVVAWIREGHRGAAIAAIEMNDKGRTYEHGLNMFRTGQIRAMLKEDSRTIAWAVGELSREAAGGAPKKKR